LQTGKNENGKTKNVLLFFISSEAKTILFFGHTRGSKKSNVKNKRQFFLSLSILTGSLPSVLGWLVAIFCVYVCLSWLTTDEQETIQQRKFNVARGPEASRNPTE
jgi:cytochrome bd-type quinol oxidase subunit 2